MKTIDGKDFNPSLPSVLLQIAERIREASGKAYLVGGWVRDAMLGRECRDFDVEVYGINQEQLLKILSRFGRPNLVGKAFGVIHLTRHGLDLDFSFPRTESKVGKGHRGFLVETHLDLSFSEAAFRRDFTINAMGVELPDLELCDPYHGKDDLQKGILRHVSPAFAEDSLRVLRGVQFASRFRLRLAEETLEFCRSLSLNDLSSERIFEEFKKWLLKPGTPSFGLDAFVAMDLMRFFPEIRPLQGRYETLGLFLDNISTRIPTLENDAATILTFAALLSGAESKEEVLRFLLRITNEVRLLRAVPALWEQAPQVLSHARANGNEFNDAFLRRQSAPLSGLILAEAYGANYPLDSENFHHAFSMELRATSRKLGVWDKAIEPYLTGRILLSLGLQPGKQVGELIRESLELQIEGKINSTTEAIAWAESKLIST
jgi:tRNA nucleotidyltransferase (CCA-adding enzyme)